VLTHVWSSSGFAALTFSLLAGVINGLSLADAGQSVRRNLASAPSVDGITDALASPVHALGARSISSDCSSDFLLATSSGLLLLRRVVPKKPSSIEFFRRTPSL